jgi:hypothetical protein
MTTSVVNLDRELFTVLDEDDFLNENPDPKILNLSTKELQFVSHCKKKE